jgi:hypothetical protein
MLKALSVRVCMEGDSLFGSKAMVIQDNSALLMVCRFGLFIYVCLIVSMD